MVRLCLFNTVGTHQVTLIVAGPGGTATSTLPITVNNTSPVVNDGSPVGTGSPISESSLAIGMHVIAASVTDNNGAPGSDQITITITGPSPA